MLVPTYTMLGHGPVVLMLHGAGGGFRSFAPQVETLASLGFRAVAWNMPGYGPSPPIEPYSFKGLAEQPGDGYNRYVEQGLAWLAEGRPMSEIADTLLPRLVGPGALPAGVQLAAHCQAQVHAATWRRALQAMASFDRRPALGLIHVPTMLIAGEHDSVAPPAQMEAMAAAITGAQCVPVPHSGHLPHLERPEEFDTLLLDFLRHAKAWLH